jgi:predicted alpha/beta superfamily hydrolase
VTGWRAYDEVYGQGNTAVGKVVVWPQLASQELGGARDIAVYLPPSLARAWRAGEVSATPARRFPVLYFNDGQNVFDARTSYVGEEWRVDETLEELAGEGIEALAVAIPNGQQQRMDEYNPWRSRVPWKTLPAWATPEMGGKGDAYLDWLVGTLKPLIDRSFPTVDQPAGTALIGSSMGGLISLYALATRPQTFGLAGALSPSVSWSNYRLFDTFRERGLADVRLYLDMGGREGRAMARDVRRLRQLLLELGCREGVELHYVEDRDGIHRESAWARRLPDALRFLLR